MKRICLSLDKKTENLYCNLHFINNKNKRVFAEKLDDKNFYIDIDNDVDYLTFSNGKDLLSDKIYAYSIAKDYRVKFNKRINKNAIYIKDNKQNGKLESFVFEDKKNLKYWKNKKRIWIYTPSNYSKNKKYGVIISFDGQNAFYKNNMKKKNVYEGIQLDEYVEILNEQYNKNFIVVGIDNGTIYRDEELTMSGSFGKVLADDLENNEGFYNGNLDLLLDFIKDTVLPFVFNNYSIDKNNIGLYGASSGGLASFYGTLRDNDIYSYCISMSPAFLLFGMNDYEEFINKFLSVTNRIPYIYLYCGNKGKLEKSLLKPTEEVYKLLDNKKEFKDKVFLRINKNGNHNELFWKMALGEALDKFVK